MRRGTADYIAAYRIRVDESLPGTLDAIRAHPARETYTALEIAGDPAQPTVASACALATDAPLAGLTPQRGNHLAALTALELQSAHRLDGHTRAPAGLLAGLSWPIPAAVRT